RRPRETRGDTSCRGQLSAGFHRHPPAASLQTGRRPDGDRGWQDLAACAGTCALISQTPAELRVGTPPSGVKDARLQRVRLFARNWFAPPVGIEAPGEARPPAPRVFKKWRFRFPVRTGTTRSCGCDITACHQTG